MILVSKIKTYISKSEFARHVLTLMSGTGLAQVIAVLASPVITRLFTPEDFGILASYTALVGIFSALICGRYEFAIVLPKKDEGAANIVYLCLGIILCASLIILAGVLFGRQWISLYLKTPALSLWLWLLPVSLLLVGLNQTFSYWNLRQKGFKDMAFSRISNASSNAITSVGLGFFTNLGASGLLAGDIFGRLASCLVLIAGALKGRTTYFVEHFNRTKIIQMAGEYKKFPVYGILPSLLDNVTLAMPVLFFTKFFDSAITGYYSLGMRIIQLPVSLIGVSISQVFHQKIASAQATTGEISYYVEQIFQKLVLVAIPFLVVMLSAPFWFEIVFGPQWTVAGKYVMILAPGVALRFAVSPISVAFGVRNRQELAAVWKVVSLISTAFFLGISLPFADPEYSLYFLVINDIFIYSLYLYLIFKISSASIKRALFTFVLR